MDNKKKDDYFFLKIVDDINIIKEYLNNASFEEFVADRRTVDAVVLRLIQIAENTKAISANFKDEHPEIDWFEIIGFRNKLVHEYRKTDYSVVYDSATNDLSKLETLLKQFL